MLPLIILKYILIAQCNAFRKMTPYAYKLVPYKYLQAAYGRKEPSLPLCNQYQKGFVFPVTIPLVMVSQLGKISSAKENETPLMEAKKVKDERNQG